MRTLPLLLLFGSVLAACAGGSAETHGESEQSTELAGFPGAADPTASGSGARAPMAPTLPPDPDYRSRLGTYADFVLGDALVPHGSPEHMQFLEACVESAGFDVNVDVDRQAISAHPPPEQAAYFEETLSQCDEAAVSSGLVEEFDDPSDQELAAWYEAFMLTHQCLVKNGYPTSDPPSEDSYIEARGQNWHPYDGITHVGAIEEDCPQDLVVLFERLASRSER